MDPVETYEAMAQQFQIDTGMTAPGKSEAPAAHSGDTHEERHAAWLKWCIARNVSTVGPQGGG